MADVAVKPEIKLDPESKTNLADVDEFEEDTDLQIPAQPEQGWLTRVPPELWQAWNDMYKDAPSDQEIQIGKLRVFNQPKDNGEQRIELHLQTGLPQTQLVPQKYEVKLTSQDYNNSVVFSEKDLPGHRTQQYGRNRHNAAAGSKPTGIDKAERMRQNKKFGGYSSVIPKQTFLAAKVSHEANLIPMRDENYYADLERSLTQAMQPKVSTTFALDKIDKNLMPGRQSDMFNTFTTSSKPRGANKKKLAKEKAVRMPQEQLYTELYKCFKRYKYWKMGSLRAQLKQPEAYIKQTLETIAYLIRSGDFVGTYALKPEFHASLDIKDEQENPADDVAKVESAGETDMGSDGADDTEGDGGDEGDFEDVKMEG